jgi:penicillin G amidase
MKRIIGAICLLLITGVVIYFASLHISGLNSLRNLANYHNGLLSKSTLARDSIVLIKDAPADVQIVIDTLGVPSIYANNMYSLGYSIGFMHARDRYFQMQLIAYSVMGRLSEMIGEVGINSDKQWKMFDLEARAKGILDSLSGSNPDLYNYLKAYAQGVNDYINSESEGHRDPMFCIWDCAPKPWMAYYSFLIQWYMSYNLTYSDYFFDKQEILDKVPYAARAMLYPMYPDSRLSIIPAAGQLPALVAPEHALVKVFQSRQANRYGPVHETRSLGSNNWIVGSSHTKGGELYLCNDLHLFLASPNIFYEAQLCCRDMHVYGYTIPGVPLVLTGQNEKIAWGLTSGEWEVTEQYLLKMDPQNENRYWLDGKWKDMTIKSFEINVKGQNAEKVDVKYTVFGPYIKRDSISTALMWHPQYSASAINAFWALMRAVDWKDFCEALRVYDYPSQNFVFGDIKGNIGMICAGKMPIKPLDYAGGLLDGTRSPQWRYIPYDSLPKAFNPPQGYLYSANQEPIRDGHYYSSRWYEDLYRPARIGEILSSGRKFDREDMRQMQLDVIDRSVQDLQRLLIKYLPANEIAGNWAMIGKWDGNLNPNRKEAFFYKFYRRAVELASSELAKKIGVRDPPHFDQFVNFLLKYDSVSLGSQKIYCRDCFRGLVKVTDSLYTAGGNNSGGDLFSFMIPQITFLPNLNVKVDSVGGSENTISVNYWAHSVVRTIIEIKDERIQSWMVNAIGQTGRINEGNYYQQLSEWKNNMPHEVQFTRDADKVRNVSGKIVFSSAKKAI